MGTSFSILAVVWDSLSQTVHRNITSSFSNSVTVYTRAFERYSTNRSEQIALVVQNALTIEELNGDSIELALPKIQNRLEASFATIYGSNSALESSNLNNQLSEQLIRDIKETARAELSDTFFYQIENSLYLVYVHQLNETQAGQSLLLGYVFDAKTLRDFADSVGFNVTMVFDELSPKTINTEDIKYSPSQLNAWQITDNYLNLFNIDVVLGRQFLYTKAIPLNNVLNTSAISYLSINADRVSSNFLTLQWTIASVSFFAVLLALIIALYLAGRITKPLSQIAKYTQRIAQGDYSKALAVGSYASEFKTLVSAFDSMRGALNHREQAIIQQAQIDPLTKIFNRNYITSVLDTRLKEFNDFQVVGINIHDFRGINDVFGYHVGDFCLIELAQRISALDGICARLTGGEIIWLPQHIHTPEQLAMVQKNIEHAISSNGININFSTTFGVLCCPRDARTIEDLYRRLNIVTDEAQLNKLPILVFNSVQEAKYLRRLFMINELKRVLSSNTEQFSLHYQPKVNLQNGKVTHVEALSRWQHPTLGQVGPDEFISLAEDAGIITQLTRWVIKQVISDLLIYQKAGYEVCVAVNMSAEDIMDTSLLRFLQDTLGQNNLSSDLILLEITEGVILNEPEIAIKHIAQLREAGFKIAIDDFGTGYSSLSYLQKLPVDILKIDRSFVYDLCSQKDNQAICKTILALADSFSLASVAEGIEDENSMLMLKDLGVTWGQGYFICRPKPINELIDWLKQY